METFKKTNLIIRVGKQIHQLNGIDELTETIFGKQYKELTAKERLLKRYAIMLPYSVRDKKPIIYSPKGIIKGDKNFDSTTKYNVANSLIIDDEITCFLSLCKSGGLDILEQKNANIFVKNMDKSWMKGNYIVINKFADKLLQTHIKSTKEKTL